MLLNIIDVRQVSLSDHRRAIVMNGGILRRLVRSLNATPLPTGIHPRTRRKLLAKFAERILTYWRFRSSTATAVRSNECLLRLRQFRLAASKARQSLASLPEPSRRELARAAGRSEIGTAGRLGTRASLPVLATGTSLVCATENWLKRLENWAAEATMATATLRDPKAYEDRVWLVAQVGHLYEQYTQLKFNRRSKPAVTPAETVKRLLAIADPEYKQTHDGIDKLMRRAIIELRLWSRSEAGAR